MVMVSSEYQTCCSVRKAQSEATVNGPIRPVYMINMTISLLAGWSCGVMKEYLAHPERFRLLGVVGVDGSPSCGVNYTSAGNWYGSFSGRKDLEQTLKGARLATGYGIFMDELCKMLREEGLAQRITVTSLFAPEPEKCLSLLEE